MSTIKAKKIVQQYTQALREANFPFSAIYLFGSHVKGKSHPWSDIDVAIVSDRLKKDRDADRILLRKVRRQVDTRIEPHGFTVEDFRNQADPLVHEIHKTGIRMD